MSEIDFFGLCHHLVDICGKPLLKCRKPFKNWKLISRLLGVVGFTKKEAYFFFSLL